MEYDWATSALHKSYYLPSCGRGRLREEESLRLSYRMKNQLSTVCTGRWYGLGKLLGVVERSSRFESWPRSRWRDVAERWRSSGLVSRCWRSTSPASSPWWELILPYLVKYNRRLWYAAFSLIPSPPPQLSLLAVWIMQRDDRCVMIRSCGGRLGTRLCSFCFYLTLYV